MLGMNMDIWLREVIRSETDLGQSRFVICPYGECGRIAEKVLQDEFGIKPVAVVDNYLAEGSHIMSIDDLSVNDIKDATVIMATVTPVVEKELTEGFKDRFGSVRIKGVKKKIPPKHFKLMRKLLAVKPLASGGTYIRVGNENAGGYVMLDNFKGIEKAYSFGIDSNVSWDRDIVVKGIGCYMFDHTIEGLPEEHPMFHWTKIGVAGTDMPERNLLSLETILRNHGDIANKNMILKLDVEGDEWDCINSTPSELLDNFDQIVLEIHGIFDDTNVGIVNALEKLRQTHQPVWVHPNNYTWMETMDGVTLTLCMEMLYLNRHNYAFGEGKVVFPWEIDSPCARGLPEVKLGEFSET